MNLILVYNSNNQFWLAGAAGSSQWGDASEVDSRSVHVGNLDFKTKEEELQQHFAGCGHVSRVTIIIDKATNKPKGFAYVQFTEASSVDVALAHAGTLIHNRPITVHCIPVIFFLFVSFSSS